MGADDNFATIVVAVREGRVVWDNLRKVLLVNTPINNAQGLSVLAGLIFVSSNPILTPIQVLYCNLICAVTLGFVTAVEPAEDGIMDVPPRIVGKSLIGKFLGLRIIFGTIVLVSFTTLATWIAKRLYEDELGGFDDAKSDLWNLMRAQASNTLTFGACGITVSARFAYNSAVHPRIFFGNKFCWYSIAIVVALQLCITYVPGLNTIVFEMGPMRPAQWGLVVIFMLSTLWKQKKPFAVPSKQLVVILMTMNRLSLTLTKNQTKIFLFRRELHTSSLRN